VDASLAAKIATKLGLSFQSVEMLKANQVADGVRDFLIAMEEPNNNPSGVSMMNLYSQIAQSGFRLALTGDGSDEIFGGYARHSNSNKLPNLFRFKSLRIIENVYDDSSLKKYMVKRLVSSQIAPESPLSWLQWHWAFNPKEISRVLRIHDAVSDYSAYMCNCILSLDSGNLLKNPMAIMKRDHEIWLSMESNRKLDRISMFNSIEARSPFQDNKIIGWARDKFSTEGKRRLNKVDLWNAYPELKSLGVRKDKAGFTSPVGHWLRNNPQLVSSSLSFLAKDERFNSEGLLSLLDAPHRGNYRELMQLWTLVVLSTWLQFNW
jgi:asparagine synthase (glutamine-hydrolysing)